MNNDGSGNWSRSVTPFLCPRPSSERTLGTAEALARLKVTIDLRDPLAAQRVLQQFSQSDEGEWLLRICLAVALERLGRDLARADGE
jgi:hypothetical protein